MSLCFPILHKTKIKLPRGMEGIFFFSKRQEKYTFLAFEMIKIFIYTSENEGSN